MLLSRVVKGPNSAKDTFGYICKSMVSIMPSDTDVEVKGVKQRVTPSGEDESTVPIRFVERLDHPEYISSSICSNVIQFVDMAKNYEGKWNCCRKFLLYRNSLIQNIEKINIKALDQEMFTSISGRWISIVVREARKL